MEQAKRAVDGFILYPLYYTTYNTAHAASRLWRYSSIYMNPSQAA